VLKKVKNEVKRCINARENKSEIKTNRMNLSKKVRVAENKKEE
jgi:hypothetical protein